MKQGAGEKEEDDDDNQYHDEDEKEDMKNILSTLKNIKNADYFVLALIPVLQYYNYTAHGQLLRGVYKIFNTKINSYML